MDNWGTTAGLDFSGYTHIRLAYRGLSSGQTLQLQLRNAGSVYGNNLDVGGQAGAYTVVELSLTSLSLGTGLNLAAISEIDMSVTGTNANGSGTVYLDAIELVNSSSGGLPASPQTWARANALGKGLNATNWLEAYWLIPFGTFPEVNKYNRTNVQALRNAGFEVFRLPATFERLGSTSPPYALDFDHTVFRLVDSMILWANLYDFKLIIDNHHGYDLTNANYTTELPRLQAVWEQLAQRYGALDPERFFFEIFNEPTNQISNANFRTVGNSLLATIRANESITHSVWVGAATWNSGYNLQTFTPLDDADVIYTFHNYDPFLFTHQGFSWTDPPYFPARTFPQTGEVAAIQDLFFDLKAWSDAYDVPVTLGEFGVSNQADASSRCTWIQTLTTAAATQGFPTFYWDAWSTSEGFGFFTDGIIDQAHVIPCFSTAMGLYPPPLAVSLETFNIDCVDDSAVLHWSAFTDAGPHYFEVERSADGVHWTLVKRLDAGSGLQAYTLRDAAKGAYYRLRTLDSDGKCRYSSILTSPCQGGTGILSVDPNPATMYTKLRWSDKTDPIIRVQLFDLTGRLLSDYNMNPSDYVRLPLQNLRAGMYQLSVLTAQGKRVSSAIVVEK